MRRQPCVTIVVGPLLLCAAPGIVAGLIVGIVLVAVGLPLVGVAALVVIAVVVPGLAVAVRPYHGGALGGRAPQ